MGDSSHLVHILILHSLLQTLRIEAGFSHKTFQNGLCRLGVIDRKTVSRENLYPRQARSFRNFQTSIPLSSIFNSCSNSLTVNGLCGHPANPCTVNSSRCMSLRAVTAITGTDCCLRYVRSTSSFSKSKPLIAGICTSVNRTSRLQCARHPAVHPVVNKRQNLYHSAEAWRQ